MYEFLDMNLARDLQKHKCARDIRFDHGCRLIDTAVDVRLGREMNDGLATGHGRFDGGRIANIALDKGVLRTIRDGIKVREISSVSQFVVVDDGMVLGEAQDVSDEIRADEARSSSYKNLHRAASLRAAPDERFILFAPDSATSILARSNDSNVPASVHQPSRTS